MDTTHARWSGGSSYELPRRNAKKLWCYSVPRREYGILLKIDATDGKFYMDFALSGDSVWQLVEAECLEEAKATVELIARME